MKSNTNSSNVGGGGAQSQPLRVTQVDLQNSGIQRRTFLRRSGAASVATILALNGLKLEVRAADTGQDEAVLYKRIKITTADQKKEVDENGTVIGDAPKGYYVLSSGEAGSCAKDVFDAVSGQGTE